MKFTLNKPVNSDNLLDKDKYLLDKIDMIITDNSNIITLGYVCSSEDVPIFLDTIDNSITKDVLQGYVRHLKLTNSGMYIVLNNEMVYVNNLWKPITVDNINVSMVHPFISSSIHAVGVTNQNIIIKVLGGNFDPNIMAHIEGIDILNVSVISDTEMHIIIGAQNTTMSNIPVEISRFGVPSFGGDVLLSIVDTVSGNGSPGEFLTDFENGGSGDLLWGPNWVLEVFGAISDVGSFFKSSKKGTPSSTTGPINNNVFTDGSTYCFTERSGSNYGTGQYATATTENFAHLNSIEFSYHRYGHGMADFSIESLNLDGTWSTKYNLSGQTQSSNSDPEIHEVLDTSSWNSSKIRMVFGVASNYASDMAINNIKISSI